jgi:hypothetical protein
MKKIAYRGAIYIPAEVEDYHIQHRAPRRDGYSAPLWRLTDLYPDDVYSARAVQYYGDRTVCDPMSIAIVQAARDKPDMLISIYRAMPPVSGETDGINPGDWVTICRPYAVQHGRGLRGKYKIVTMKAKASDLFTDGNSIHEWGYDPL